MSSIFENIINEPLLINDNSLFNKIHTETEKYLYILTNQLNNFLNYLMKIFKL